MLAQYGINAETLRFDDGKDAKGYRRAAFAVAWNAYLSDEDGNQTVEPLTRLETSGFGDQRTVDGAQCVNGSESAENPGKQAASTVQQFGNQGGRKEGTPEPLRESTSALPAQPCGSGRAGDAYRKVSRGE